MKNPIPLAIRIRSMQPTSPNRAKNCGRYWNDDAGYQSAAIMDAV
jgi:hypothetical protein